MGKVPDELFAQAHDEKLRQLGREFYAEVRRKNGESTSAGPGSHWSVGDSDNGGSLIDLFGGGDGGDGGSD
jgi:hypothetical protein